MFCFKRYNLVTEDELAQIKWPSYEDSGGTEAVTQSVNSNLEGNAYTYLSSRNASVIY